VRCEPITGTVVCLMHCLYIRPLFSVRICSRFSLTWFTHSRRRSVAERVRASLLHRSPGETLVLWRCSRGVPVNSAVRWLRFSSGPDRVSSSERHQLTETHVRWTGALQAFGYRGRQTHTFTANIHIHGL